MATVKAVIVDAPGPANALQIQDLPILTPGPEQVLIKVAASGLNRSELHTWLGLVQRLTFPSVLGIEAAGTVAACPGGQFSVCQQDLPRLGIEPNGQGAVRRLQHFGHRALCGPGERGPEWHHLPHRNTRVVGRPATVGIAGKAIQTVC
jgi:hypothetical protein